MCVCVGEARANIIYNVHMNVSIKFSSASNRTFVQIEISAGFCSQPDAVELGKSSAGDYFM